MLIEEKLGNKVYFRNIIILHPEITSVDHSVYFHVNLSRFIFLFTKLYHNVCLCVYTHTYSYIYVVLWDFHLKFYQEYYFMSSNIS